MYWSTWNTASPMRISSLAVASELTPNELTCHTASLTKKTLSNYIGSSSNHSAALAYDMHKLCPLHAAGIRTDPPVCTRPPLQFYYRYRVQRHVFANLQLTYLTAASPATSTQLLLAYQQLIEPHETQALDLVLASVHTLPDRARVHLQIRYLLD